MRRRSISRSASLLQCMSPVVGDSVAKPFAASQTRNYRIPLNDFLNRCCAPVLVLESILLILLAKIVLQHNRGQSGQHLLTKSLSAHGPEETFGCAIQNLLFCFE